MTARQVLTTSQRMELQQRLSERHRLWGANLPALDLDEVGGTLTEGLFLEYNHRVGVALIDYKHTHDTSRYQVDETDSNLIAGTRLAEDAKRPFYVVAYTDNGDQPGTWTFRVYSLNMRAAQARIFPQLVADFTEPTFIRWLHAIRGRRT